MVEHIFGETMCKEASRCIRKTPTSAGATTLKSITFPRREAKGGGAFRGRENRTGGQLAGELSVQPTGSDQA